MIVRKHLEVLKTRLDKESRRFIQCLYGPRQVGKTTLIRQYMAQTDIMVHFASGDAVPVSNGRWISEEWQSVRFTMQKQNLTEAIIIIDEIQKVKDWSEYVKREWDADTASGIQLKCVILGSSRLLLQQGLTESLAGRFESMYIPHWSYSEMHEAFGFTYEQYAWFGGYPGAATLIGDEERWRQYVMNSLIETSVSKDIVMLTRIDKPALLKRVFELACVYSGKELSYTKMLGQLQDAGNTVTLAHYLTLLDQAGLVAGLEKYAGERVRQRASSPKYQVHNNGLLAAQHKLMFEEAVVDSSAWGRVVESAVGAHLLNAALENNMKLWYWRDGNNEVDFVLEQRGRTIGIEVKSGKRTQNLGLEKFEKAFKPDKLITISNSGISWKDVLEIEPKMLFTL